LAGSNRTSTAGYAQNEEAKITAINESVPLLQSLFPTITKNNELSGNTDV